MNPHPSLIPPRASSPHRRVLRALAAFLLGALPLGAADQVVTNTNDADAGSLRQAIADAAAGDRVTFDAALSGQTITLSSGQLTLDKSLTIDASALAGGLTIDGGGASRLFQIAPGTAAVTLDSLTLTGGRATGTFPASTGGAIYHNGTELTLLRTTLAANQSDNVGGALYIPSGRTVAAHDCAFHHNHGGAGGGAVRNDGALTAVNTTFTANTANNFGGAIHSPGDLSLTHCTLAANQADNVGGALYIAPGRTVAAHDCAFHHNHAGTGGGAVRNDGALTAVNTTFAANTANNFGGAIHSPGDLSLTHCTLAANQAGADGTGSGGGLNFGANSVVTLANTIVAGNTAPDNGPDINVNAGGTAITTTGVNLLGDLANSGLVEGATVLVADPLLAPLGDYGGATPTMLPDAGSPAIDAGGASALTTDQRGVPRPLDGEEVPDGVALPDIGAVERASSRFLTVTTTADEDNGGLSPSNGAGTSLREAVVHGEFGVTVSFAPDLSGQTISLGAGQLVIDKSLTIDASSLPRGIALSGGGAHRVIEAGGFDVTLRALTIQDGKSQALGAGLFKKAGGVLRIDRCTFWNNLGATGGAGAYSGLHAGAIFSRGDLVIENSTFSANTDSILGSVIRIESGNGNGVHAVIAHSTIAGNLCSEIRGALYFDEATSATVVNCVLSGNTNPVSQWLPDIIDGGGNYLAATGAQLAPLGDYGGPTRTMPPLPGSPVIDRAEAAAVTSAADQRGFPRLVGAAPDSGAVEFLPDAPVAAAKTDTALEADHATPRGAGSAVPGQRVEYAATLTAGGSAADVLFEVPALDPNTTFVPGSVTITPIAADDHYQAVQGVPLVVTAPSAGLLANDADPDRSGVLVVNDPGAARTGGTVTGTLAVAADGTFTYTAPATGVGSETFAYTINDNGGAGLDCVDPGIITFTVTHGITSDGGGPAAAVSVAENGFAVTDIETSHPANDPATGNRTLHYSIAGGVDAALFLIDAGTGVLIFARPPDFENPLDANRDNVYEVRVLAAGFFDGSRDYQDIAVTVTDGDMERPVIVSNGGRRSVALRVLENQTAVTDVEATDADGETEGAGLSYSLTGGADAAFFALDPATGVLTFVAPPDFENPLDAGADNVYEVQVAVADSTPLTNVQDIAVAVDDVHLPLAIISAASVNVDWIPDHRFNLVIDVEGTDEEGVVDGPGLSYSLTGGEMQSFTIESATGKLRYVGCPFDQSEQFVADHDIRVTVSNGRGQSASQLIRVVLQQVFSFPSPELTSDGGGPTAAISVPENQTQVTDVETTRMEGVCFGGYPDIQSISYFLQGADQALFAIDGETGVLTFNAPPDFENPLDAGADNEYHVRVGVVDYANGFEISYQDIAITVTDVVPEDPVICSDGGGETAFLNVTENETAVTVVEANPSNGAALSYVLGDPFSHPDADLFFLDPATGVLRFVSAPDFESPLDSDGDNVYVVSVFVYDSELRHDAQLLEITVLDDPEQGPVITSDGGGATAALSAAGNQTSVTDVEASDPDGDTEGAGLTYSITGGADQALFALDAGTGVLSFLAAPDHGNPLDAGADNVYDVQVTVTDSTSLTDVQDIAVHISGPAITSNGGGPAAAVLVRENETAVTDVNAADDSDGEGAGLTYALTGGADEAFFTIDAVTGVLTFLAAPNHENPLDAGADNRYEVRVTVTDSALLADSQDIVVTVVDRLSDLDPPVIVSDGGESSAAISVEENRTAVTVVATEDPAFLRNVGFSLPARPDSAFFAIDFQTGVLSFNAPPDFENPLDAGADNVYHVTVAVSTRDVTVTQDLAITVTDVSPEEPVITSDGGGATASLTVPENETAVTAVQAAHPQGAGLSYAISGGADAARFSIVASTGVVTFDPAPDFEAPADAGADNVYDLQVTATDPFGGTDVQDLAVTVTDINEPLVITDGGPPEGFVLSEETFVTDINAVDDHFAEGAGLAYSLTGGADRGLFHIDRDTGVLRFREPPLYCYPYIDPADARPGDADRNNQFEVEVTVNGADGQEDRRFLNLTLIGGSME